MRTVAELTNLARERYREGVTQPLDVTLEEARSIIRAGITTQNERGNLTTYQEGDLTDSEIDEILAATKPLMLDFVRLNIVDAPWRARGAVAPAIALGHDLQDYLCEIFRLDPKLVEHLSFDVEPTGLVRLTTTRYVTLEEGEKIKAIMYDYALVKLAGEEPEGE